MAIHMICGKCGSDNVRADAYAAWDSEEGDWVLHSVYDARHCENCEGPASLIEVDEAEGLEIGFYGMINDGDGVRLVQDDETPDFFDVTVRTTNLDGGEILTLFEFDDQSRKEANGRMVFLTALFPDVPIDWHLGKQPEFIPRSNGKHFEVTREQWETHKTNAPETYSNCDVSPEYITEKDWQYFKLPEQTCATSGTGEGWPEYALCPTTGIIRYPTLAEHCDIFGGGGW